jgi:membrane protein
MKKFFQNAWLLARETFQAFSDDNVFKLSASLAYYTVFSLSPMLLIVISVCSIFFGREAIQGQVQGQIRGLVGEQAAVQIQEMIKNAEFSDQTAWATVVGVGTLLLGATGVFTEIQDSLNVIWSVKAKPRQGWLKIIINRLLSFSMIGSIGFLLIVSLVVNTFLDVFSERLSVWLPGVAVVVLYVINLAVVVSILTAIFTLIYRVLPDAKLRWKDALIGAVATTVLFMIGKSLIGLYLSQSNAGTAYGAAGSLILILLWVYYSSTILFLGAEFTKVYAGHFGKGIVPKEDAVLIKKEEVEQDEMEIRPSA